ncbi:MAG: hypothetical protein HYX69_22660 [Planctomycetia bacterium]|nr:hypothetical protein [Planctomycetia bacterium]
MTRRARPLGRFAAAVPFRAPPSSCLNAPLALRAALAVAVCATAGGCAGYRVGSASMFPPDIQTVYVPVFQSDSYRRDLSERITEAVAKEIQRRTGYTVVATPNADSVLSGRLLNETKRITVESPTDEPRDTQLDFLLEVTWVDRQGALLSQGQKIPVPASVVNVQQTADVVPEIGQSMATGQQAVIDKLAKQVVSLMETPW